MDRFKPKSTSNDGSPSHVELIIAYCSSNFIGPVDGKIWLSSTRNRPQGGHREGLLLGYARKGPVWS